MKSLAIITGPSTYLDHLGILSIILNIPLVVTEPKTYELAKKFYPGIPVTLKEMAELSLDFLATNADVIFQTGKFWATELLPFFELFYQKKMRFIYCPHGNSDKGYSLKIHPFQDISLAYGNHMLDLLKKTKARDSIKQIILTGNYRLEYYLENKAFYDSLINLSVNPHLDPQLETIFYAPTWSDKENTTSFFAHFDALAKGAKGVYNLIVKLHPFLEETHPAEVYQLAGRYENHPHVFFINDFPSIYPLLEKCNLYLGDFSSIGYDFLAFGKPLYFLHGHTSHFPLISQAGMSIPANENCIDYIKKTYAINKASRSLKRKKVYDYVFGKKKESGELKKEIYGLLYKITPSF